MRTIELGKEYLFGHEVVGEACRGIVVTNPDAEEYPYMLIDVEAGVVVDSFVDIEDIANNYWIDICAVVVKALNQTLLGASRTLMYKIVEGTNGYYELILYKKMYEQINLVQVEHISKLTKQELLEAEVLFRLFNASEIEDVNVDYE